MSYYIGTSKDMPKDCRKEVDAFIGKNGNVVVLGTTEDKGVHLTLMGFLSEASLDNLYMQTYRSSDKVQNILANDVVEIAVSDATGGVILTCKAEVIDDSALKAEKWEKWMEQYHPDGCTSPEYVLLKFTLSDIKVLLNQC